MNRLLEHEKFKSAAQMLLQKQQIEDAVLSNPSLKEFMEAEGTEPEIAADVIDLVKTFQQVLERVRTRPVINVDEETVTVGQMIDYLRRRLSLEDRPIRLKQLLMRVPSRPGAGVHVPGAAGMVRLQAIQVRQDRLFGEIAVRKHTHFDEIMNEQGGGTGRLEMRNELPSDAEAVRPRRVATGDCQLTTIMSLKAQLEAIIYAAETPITLEQMIQLVKETRFAAGAADDAEVKSRVRSMPGGTRRRIRRRRITASRFARSRADTACRPSRSSMKSCARSPRA